MLEKCLKRDKPPVSWTKKPDQDFQNSSNDLKTVVHLVDPDPCAARILMTGASNKVVCSKLFIGFFIQQWETAFGKQLATDDADIHIVKTAIETYEKMKKQVVVIDLLVLPTALTPDYMDILMLKEGKGEVKDRFYCSKDLQNSNLVI
ncbi:hypothetical protein AVEN_50969-1 [Araneus ventricosus]|uniref:Uncharacterized protein n=1 Tax=Araneus ventricosus TaxID=182803 RepID=A0A4Y2KJE2_ARAVE|nr:hypothetical protein AVEN_50969-1 [Araneus ventricosus]